MTRGYFSIGIYQPKKEVNVGTLWRSAFQLGAAFTFTIGRRYEQQASDTTTSWRHMPLFHFPNWDDFQTHLPYQCPLVGIEMGGRQIGKFVHPERCIYLLGAEDYGLPQHILDKCIYTVSLPAVRTPSYNVAVAGSMVMFDRTQKTL